MSRLLSRAYLRRWLQRLVRAGGPLGLAAVVACQSGAVPADTNVAATVESAEARVLPAATPTATPELVPEGRDARTNSVVERQATPTATPELVPEVTPEATPAATPTATPTPRATPRPTVPPTPTPAPVPPSAAVQPAVNDLSTRLSAYRAAVRGGRDIGTALRLQRELFAAADQAEAALRDDKSRQADGVRLAIADVRAGIAGDNNRLDAAERNLRQAPGGPTAGAAFGVVASAPVLDTGRLLESMNEKLRGYRQALRDRNTDGALKAQGELLANLGAAEQAAQRDQSEQGRTLRDALADLRKGLDGDAERLASAAAGLGRFGGAADDRRTETDTPRVAASLLARVDAFRTAVAAGSRAEVLRLQREVLAEADQAAAALRADESADGRALRDAIAAVRAGASGDLIKLDGARASLIRLAGEMAAGAAVEPIVDLVRFAGDLATRVAGLQEAFQKNDTGSMLRLQRELLEETERGDAALKQVKSKPAEEMRAAIAAICTAFAGDLGKLDEALLHLRAAGGAAGSGSGPRDGAAARPPVDLQPLANELNNRLPGLRDAVRDRQPPEEMARRREALKAGVAKADEALRGVTGVRAERLRAALNALREAAAGDDAKIEVAAKLLAEALQG